MELVIKDISKNYGLVEALKKISYTMNEGVYGLLGPNGAGKTTLMKCLSTEIVPSSGNTTYDGRDILTMGSDYRCLLGYMPQQQNVYGEYTGRMFLRYIAALKGLNKSDAKRRIEYLLGKYNLATVAHKKIRTYSGGMKQRLLLVQALLNDPKILLLDEPTVGVDPDERIKIRNHISELATSRIVLLSTHIVSDLISTANEIILLKQGEIVANGDVTALVRPIVEITYEVICGMDQLKLIKEHYQVLAVTNLGRDVKVRILSEQSPVNLSSMSVIPTVEDAYLYYMSSELGGE